MFAGSPFPKLKGTASAIRFFIKPLMATFVRFMNPANDMHRMVHLGLKLSNNIEEVLGENSREFKLPPDAHEKFKSLVWGFVNVVVNLGNRCHTEGLMLFNFTVKFHYLLHIALYSRYINPLTVWCYGGESFMQVAKKLTIACHRGRTPKNVVHSVMTRYAQMLGYQLIDADNMWR